MFRRISAVATVLVLGLMLAGCDKCGDWFWNKPASGVQSCKGSLPPQ
jgi:hypothetical protein